MSYAYLSLPSRNYSEKLAIVAYGFNYASSIQGAQQRLQSANYPIRAAQNGLNFTIKCRSEAQWDRIKDKIRDHQYDVLTVSDPSAAFFRLLWPEQSMDYTFVIKAGPGGTQRFQTSPELTLSVDLIFDNLFGDTNKFFDPGSRFDIIDGVVNNGEFIKPIDWTVNTKRDPATNTNQSTTGNTEFRE